jgi:hypothetical protein
MAASEGKDAKTYICSKPMLRNVKNVRLQVLDLWQLAMIRHNTWIRKHYFIKLKKWEDK